ncbi:hypothetical protein [Clostridium algidicarnis]|uniref:Prepilin-type N-terminal cleavage/methylation domain-containing protein n=2 Tax=Clostridium algidicarnis TaxID=37659 RepID=A0A2S6G1J7_9CLOT|nr:hypothetical protein [Clostridium algidicarnis]MBB6631262.1 hypothetical protein [Clostridium algidicarnis]MBU3193826.1 hypothetical protein [Clostridium algidicarnis]MBU3219850.1 hypothetical protein [Clostridium algidicarnis]MCB2285683.1 hypothetical protein [Clostridium algidicarnis]PPK49768.1 hypothetical protein BD821_101434 [Clostridium algidicarnis DSM 15099]
MRKLNNNNSKGSILVETLIAFSILILIINTFFMCRSYYFKETINQEDSMKETLFLEALKNEIYYNQSFEDWELTCNKEYYIENEYIKMDFIKHKNILEIMKEESQIKKPYIKINTIKTEDILEVNIIFIKEYSSKKIKLYKGNY